MVSGTTQSRSRIPTKNLVMRGDSVWGDSVSETAISLPLPPNFGKNKSKTFSIKTPWITFCPLTTDFKTFLRPCIHRLQPQPSLVTVAAAVAVADGTRPKGCKGDEMICHKLVNGVVARARRAATAWAPPRADAAVILCTKYVLLHTYMYMYGIWTARGGRWN